MYGTRPLHHETPLHVDRLVPGRLLKFGTLTYLGNRDRKNHVVKKRRSTQNTAKPVPPCQCARHGTTKCQVDLLPRSHLLGRSKKSLAKPYCNPPKISPHQPTNLHNTPQYYTSQPHNPTPTPPPPIGTNVPRAVPATGIPDIFCPDSRDVQESRVRLTVPAYRCGNRMEGVLRCCERSPRALENKGAKEIN